MSAFMDFQTASAGVTLPTDIAGKWFVASMDQLVRL